MILIFLGFYKFLIKYKYFKFIYKVFLEDRQGYRDQSEKSCVGFLCCRRLCLLQEQLVQHDPLKRQREDLTQAKNLSSGFSGTEDGKILLSFQLCWQEDISSVNITASLNAKEGAGSIWQDSDFS